MTARKSTITSKIVSIKFTSQGTNKNLFSAETPEKYNLDDLDIQKIDMRPQCLQFDISYEY